MSGGLFDCPECDGRGGGRDYWGEWDDCPCCMGIGKMTPARYDAWKAELAAIDADIDAQMSVPSERCGVALRACKCATSTDGAVK